MEDYSKLSYVQLLVQKTLHPEHQVLIDSILQEIDKERAITREREERDHQLQLAQLRKASPSVEVAPPKPFGYLEQFKNFLLMHGVDRPDEKVIKIIVTKFAYQMIVSCGSPALAFDLYTSIRDLPSTTTKLKLHVEYSLNVSGPLDISNKKILCASDKSGKQFILKILIAGFDDVRQLEVRISKIHNEKKFIGILGLDKPSAPLVTQELISFKSEHREKDFDAIKMPRYIVTVAKAPKFFLEALASGGKSMIEAVSFLHSKGIVHMDIKGDNIFINEKGDWLLGDFGSSTLIGQPITSMTECFYPENLFGKVAEVKYDWYMLLVTLLIECLDDKENLKELLTDTDGVKKVNHDIIKKKTMNAMLNPILHDVLKEITSKFEFF